MTVGGLATDGGMAQQHKLRNACRVSLLDKQTTSTFQLLLHVVVVAINSRLWMNGHSDGALLVH